MKVSSEDWIYDILGEALSIILKREIGSDILSNSLVTFVPRHERDMKEDRFKGIKFNQAELLAKSLANKLGLRVNNLIEKLEPTQRSPEDRVARYQRVQRIYSLKPEALGIIRGINVILVDDVRTTGATSTYISGLLHSNGAASVYVAVAGRSVFNEDYNDFYNIELEKCSMIASD
jgi:competence protein ComFC